MKKHPEFLTAEEERDLAAKAHAGDIAARDRLVESQSRLVHKIAHRYRFDGMSYDDIAQEGMIGLLKAISKFNPDKARLTTYATNWIIQYIHYGRKRMDSMVRCPAYVHEKRKGVWKGDEIPTVYSLSATFDDAAVLSGYSAVPDIQDDPDDIAERHRRVEQVREAVKLLDRKDQVAMMAIFGVGRMSPLDKRHQHAVLRVKPELVDAAGERAMSNLRKAMTA